MASLRLDVEVAWWVKPCVRILAWGITVPIMLGYRPNVDSVMDVIVRRGVTVKTRGTNDRQENRESPN